MQDEKTTFDTIIEDAQEYYNAKHELATLKIAAQSSKAISAASAGLLLTLIFVLVILFASVALGFTLTSCFGSASLGFLTVAGLYLLIFLVLFINKEKWLITPVSNTVIKNFFKDEQHGKN